MAFKGADGVYVSAVANYTTMYTGDPYAKKDICLELMFPHGDRPQFNYPSTFIYLSGDGTTVNTFPVYNNYINAAAKTVDRGNSVVGTPRYTTTFEVFLPYDILGITNAGSNGNRIGLVFWYAQSDTVFWCDGNFNPYVNNGYYLYSDGLFETAK